MQITAPTPAASEAAHRSAAAAARPSLRRPSKAVLADLLVGPLGAALVAVAVGVAMWVWADRHDLLLLYGDARSHLTIARRIFDGPNPGVGQLGTVWLPLPHVLMAFPSMLSTSLWSSGAASALLGIGCLAVEAACVWRITFDVSRSRPAAWVAVVVLVANPGWVYLHVTAMTEPVLFASLLWCVAGLARWMVRPKPYSGGEIALFCGLPAAAAVLSRYDGWALVAAGTVFVFAAARLRWKEWRYAWRCARSFATPSAVAALWWFAHNWVRYGDPLEFQRGDWSAQSQQKAFAAAGLLPDAGNLWGSVSTFVHASVGGIGAGVAAVGVVSMVAWLACERRRPQSLAPWLLVVVPAGFYVLSLYTGQIVIWFGELDGSGTFNLRYGLQVLPGLAVFCGLGLALARRVPHRWVRTVLSLLVATATAVAVVAPLRGLSPESVPVIDEGLGQHRAGRSAWAAAEFLAANASSGDIAVDDSVHTFLPVIGADLNRVVAPFSGPRWDAVLADPSTVDWLMISDSGKDRVRDALEGNESAAAQFDVVFRDGDFTVLHHKERR